MRQLMILLGVLVLLPIQICGQEISSVGMAETAVPAGMLAFSDGIAFSDGVASYSLPAGEEQPAYKQTVYWKRYKVLKATGWTAFSLGFATTLVGVFGGAIEETLSGKEPAVWDALGYTGLGLVVASVPMLTFGYKNKQKAKKEVAFSLAASQLSVDLPSGGKQCRPAVGISVNF